MSTSVDKNKNPELSFWNPVKYGNLGQTKTHKAIESVDNYFNLGGRTATVIILPTVNGLSTPVRLEDARHDFFLTVLKIISYATVIIPIIMLIVKTILRLQNHFHVVSSSSPDDTPLPETTSQLNPLVVKNPVADTAKPIEQGSVVENLTLRLRTCAEIIRTSAETGLVLSKDVRANIAPWIKKIVALQQRIIPLLPPLTLKDGDSQGFTYSIRKEGRLLGYLHGTAHENTHKQDQISADTQKRLSECAILGTEVNQVLLNELGPIKGLSPSVETSLSACAAPRGIAFIGIDDTEAEIGLIRPWASREDLGRFKENVRMMEEAYYTGDLKKIRKGFQILETIAPLLNKEKHMVKRNHVMAENIDVFLKECDKVATEMHSDSIKCFFAVGAAHIVLSSPDNIVELLQKKGWTMKFIPPKAV